MTQNDPSSGRRALRRSPLRGLSFIVLALLATPALAAPGLAGDSADALPATSASRALLDAGLPPLPAQKAVLFASDVNQIIAAQTQAAETAAEPEGRIKTLLQRAYALLGTPYRWGGTSPDGGFDCSGLVGYVFRSALGIELPRVSREMANNGEQVEREALSAGDLVFFSRRGKRVDHVGIYVGNGQFVHAPRRGRDVTVSSLTEGYWSHRFLQARRVPGV